MSLPLAKLEYFLCCCSCRSFNEAAERLHLSQPALSHAITDLEAQYGLRLFYRDAQGIRLTREGKVFAEQTRLLLEQVHRGEEGLYTLGQVRALYLGMPPMLAALLYPRLQSAFQAEHPQHRLRMTERGTQALLQGLIQDEWDVVIVPEAQDPDQEKRVTLLEQMARQNIQGCYGQDLETVAVLSPEHPLAQRTEVVGWAELAQETLIFFEEDFQHTQRLQQAFASRGLEPKILHQTAQLYTVMELVRAGMGIGFALRPLAEQETGVSYVRLAEPLCWKIALLWRESDPLIQKLIQMGQNPSLL